MTFGAYIRGKRLEMKLGLRTFAESIGEDAGNWCRVESGKFAAPGDIKILNKICEVLGIKHAERERIFDLAAQASKEQVPADLKRQIKENEVIPLLFRTIDKKKLTKEQLKQLVKRIADEY